LSQHAAETKLGAMNRVRAAKDKDGNFDIYAGNFCTDFESSSSFSLTRTHERARTHTNTHTHTPGVEGGLEENGDGKLECFAWLIFLSGEGHEKEGEKVGAARTATFELPEQVTLLHDEAIKLDLKHL